MGCGTVQKRHDNTKRASIVLFPGQFVQNLSDSVYDHYEVKDSLGSGSFGTVVSAVHKVTREFRAIKIINKYKLQSGNSQKVINEVLVLKKLDHPHIVKVYEFNEDEFNLYVVMELCQGGELLDTIIKRKCVSEVDAALYMKQILSAVFYMHSQGIVHRDLKLENMLLDNKTSRNIKIADFGAACEYVQGTKMNHTIGTINYIAPEVFRKKYTEKCDMWSCGVILYILLSGRPPFHTKDKKKTINLIKKGEYSFESEEWAGVSNQAKEFITKLLETNYHKRLSAEEAFNDPWLNISEPLAPNQSQVNNILKNLTTFGETTKFQKAVIRYIVDKCLKQSDKNEFSSIFKHFDTSGDGKISKAEFMNYFKKAYGTLMSDAEISAIMACIDTDKNGFVDYSEFMAAAMDKSKLLSLKNLESAFKAFDRDGNGKITAQELKSMLKSADDLDIEVYHQLIKEVDQNRDGMVDFGELKDMMNKLL